MRGIGEPYANMTEDQKAEWLDFRSNLPWLNSGHRQVLRLACILMASASTDPEFGIQKIKALSALLSKLGATPVDESKITYDPGDEEQPEDEFFSDGRPN